MVFSFTFWNVISIDFHGTAERAHGERGFPRSGPPRGRWEAPPLAPAPAAPSPRHPPPAPAGPAARAPHAPRGTAAGCGGGGGGEGGGGGGGSAARSRGWDIQKHKGKAAGLLGGQKAVSFAFLETVLETVRCLGVYGKVREKSSLPGVVVRFVIAKGRNKHRKRFGFTQRPREPIAQRRAALRDPAEPRSGGRAQLEEERWSESTKTGPRPGPIPARNDGPRVSPLRSRRSSEPHLGGGPGRARRFLSSHQFPLQEITPARAQNKIKSVNLPGPTLSPGSLPPPGASFWRQRLL
ncbi:xylosyltransferase 1-like [Centrocercus urophasianus]|uniref:xylosyltransferase 1-like n=1 Tax=Centrocercus urophasianus TaxID=9002 RepID=UPI001C64E9D4|nr:xylosyltransferase 1-like [Centrocercus urophasianus]